MDYKAEQKGRENKKAIIGKRLQTEPLHIVADEHPELMYNFSQLETNIRAYKRQKKEDKPTCEGSIPNTWGIDLPVLEVKRKHYWIYSYEGDYGKTTFKNVLAKQHRVAHYE